MSTAPPPSGHRPSFPTSADPSQTGFSPATRVRWLSPAVLARTAVQVALSRTFGQFADRRELQKTEAASPLDLAGHHHDGPPEDFWLDFVADTGDGFDATTTVASQLAADELEVGLYDQFHRTRAGSLLVMGGDEVYPAASTERYHDRLIGPFRSMLPWTERPRWLVALPGNHDWYDGLTSFLRTFCQQRWIGGWKTVQARSYFAVRLPGGWWLWGVDTQLADEIDKPQLDYFRAIAQQLRPDDAIILCWATPCWAEADEEHPELYGPFEFFERTVIQERAMLRVALSGDTHHYARYRDAGGAQRFTAGGGGAYLAATHHLPKTLTLPPPASRDLGKGDPVDYRLECSYPSAEQSRRLRRGIWSSIFGNSKFWALPALIYGLLGLVIGQTFPSFGRSNVLFADIAQLVVALLLLAGVYLGLTAFTGLKRLPGVSTRRWLGAGHTFAHLVVVLASAAGLRLGGVQLKLGPAWTATIVLAGCAVVGALVGTVVFAGYLLIADRVGPHGVNTNELFAAQAIGDYKNFLRLRIAPDGTLTIYPIKIEKSVRWTFAEDGGRNGDRRWYRPVDKVEPQAELIEPPIVVAKRAAGQTGQGNQSPREPAPAPAPAPAPKEART